MRVLRDPGDVILRGEFRDVVICVQQVDDNVSRGAEPLWGVDLDREQLRREINRTVEVDSRNPVAAL